MFPRLILSLTVIWFGLFCTARGVSAAPKEESKAITTITKNLLDQAKSLTISYRAFYKDIEAHPERYAEIRLSLELDRILAQLQKEERAGELAAAIQAKVELLVAQLVLPHAVNLHEGMLELVADYKGQACAPGGDPDACIEGAWDRRRSAMGTIIDSQASDVQTLETIGDNASSLLASIAQELQNINADPSLLEYGNEHYVDKRELAIQFLSNSVLGVAPFFDGLNVNGQQTTVYLPCLIGMQIPLSDFKTELETLKTQASAFSVNHEGWLNYVDGFLDYYDGNELSPGILSHWNGCMSSKQLQINTLQAALTQARSEGNMALAAIFDADINQLEQEIRQLQIESLILQLRRNQIAAILASEGAQFDPDEPTNIAWVSTVYAHANNLIKGMLSYPSALRAIDAVVLDALGALTPLHDVSDPTSFHDLASQASTRVSTDITRGLDRLKFESSFVGRTVLPNLAQAIRIGESALTSNIDTYEGILALQFQAVQQELASLPAQLVQAEQAIAIAQTNLSNAAQFVQDLDAALVSHDVSVQAIAEATQLLESLLGMARFNPLFADVANGFLGSLATDKRYRKIRTKVHSGLTKLLKKFDAHSPGSGKMFLCKKKKGACASPLVRKAAKRRDQLISTLGGVLDTSSSAYLGGKTISELMTSIANHNNSILSR